jgi:rhamnulokinase/L-fuculokinase
MAKKYLAFDFGASSGRAIIGALNEGKLEMKEIHRFPNDPVMMNGRFLWDLPPVLRDHRGLEASAREGGVDAIGIKPGALITALDNDGA